MVAAFRFFVPYNNFKITHLEFRRQVAKSLIKSDMVRHRFEGPTAQSSETVRYDGVNHFLKTTIQGKCIISMKNTRILCTKYLKRLHKICSDIYNTKK